LHTPQVFAYNIYIGPKIAPTFRVLETILNLNRIAKTTMKRLWTLFLDNDGNFTGIVGKL